MGRATNQKDSYLEFLESGSAQMTARQSLQMGGDMTSRNKRSRDFLFKEGSMSQTNAQGLSTNIGVS